MFKRMVSPVVLAFTAFLFLVFAAQLPQATESSRPNPFLPQTVLATDCVTDPACSTSNEVVAAVYARHKVRHSGADADIEPKQATSWRAVAIYLSTTGGSASADCDCDSAVASITANITYDESANTWVAAQCISVGFDGTTVDSNNCSSFASPFVSVAAFADSTCLNGGTGSIYNSSGYRLRVGLAESVAYECSTDTANSPTYYPYEVHFQATSISPDGKRIASLCSEQTTNYVRTRAQSRFAVDSGPFECLSNSNAGGIPSLLFRYKLGNAPASTPTPTATNTPTPSPTP